MLNLKYKIWGSRLLAAMVLVSIAGAGLALTDDDAKTPKGDPWPLDTCAVSGEKLDSMGDAVVYDHEGRDIRFCCKACIGTFKKNPDEYLAKANKQIIEQQLKNYPLETCVVRNPRSRSTAGHGPLVQAWGSRSTGPWRCRRV